jgi:hypothetical protein
MLIFADRALEECRTRDVVPSGESQKAIGEGRTCAIFALGLAKAFATETWMRLVHPRERAPDVQVMYFDQNGPRGSHRMNVLYVEVATYTTHSSEALADFLFRVKLDPTKRAYSDNTVIVVFVQRGTTPEEIRVAHEELQGRDIRLLCYLVGRFDDVRFQVAQVMPQFRGAQTINLDEAFASGQMPVAEVKRGMSSVVTVSEKPISTPNPFIERLQASERE